MSQLPTAWCFSKLDNLFSFVLGGDWGKEAGFNDEEYVDVLCIRGSEYKNWKNNKANTASLRKIKKTSEEKRSLRAGDILIEISGGGPDQPVGRTALIDNDVLSFKPEVSKVCTNFLRMARPFELINSTFLNYYLTYFYNSGEVIKYQGGSNNLRNLKFKEYVTIEIPVAPLNEQTRIANKLDSLLTKVDAAKTRLDKIPTILKRFRLSVLAAATSGRLTEEWRGGDEIDEKGFPIEWSYKKLNELGELARGKSKHRPRNDPMLYGGDYPFIQTGDVAQSGGLLTNHKKTYSEFGLAQSRLFPKGTLCITIAANIADTAILTYPACFPDSVVGFIAADKECDNLFIKYLIDIYKDHLELLAPATAQKNINLAILNSIDFPIPSVIEQKEIIRRVEELFSLANAVEKQYQAAKSRVDKLTQSILAKAFRGELVPQDPNDEPAKKLFEHIQSLREQENKKQPKKKRTTKKKAKKKVIKII